MKAKQFKQFHVPLAKYPCLPRAARKALILAEDMSWADCLNTGRELAGASGMICLEIWLFRHKLDFCVLSRHTVNIRERQFLWTSLIGSKPSLPPDIPSILEQMEWGMTLGFPLPFDPVWILSQVGPQNCVINFKHTDLERNLLLGAPEISSQVIVRLP